MQEGTGTPTPTPASSWSRQGTCELDSKQADPSTSRFWILDLENHCHQAQAPGGKEYAGISKYGSCKLLWYHLDLPCPGPQAASCFPRIWHPPTSLTLPS